jgi:hypothetical protein
VNHLHKPDAVTHAHFSRLQLKQGSPFSYACNRCKRCCRNFSITVTPFDLLRLAENLGLTTTETIRRHFDGNNRLRRRKDGACSFLTGQGCAVHLGRPLVCRMYPLARHITHSGESFSVLSPVLESASEWGLDGTVASYLTEQDAVLSIEGYNLYSRLHYRIGQRLRQAEERGRAPGRMDGNSLGIGLFPGSVLDPDPAIMNYCLRNKLPIPTGLRDKAACHVLAIEEWVNLKLKEMCHDQV